MAKRKYSVATGKKTRRFSVVFPFALCREIDKQAKKVGVTRSRFVVDTVQKVMARRPYQTVKLLGAK